MEPAFSKHLFRDLALWPYLARACVCVLIACPLGAAAQATGRWWSDACEDALSRSGSNRVELVRALHSVPPPQRRAMEFLVENMPAPDLASLSGEFLLENVALAFAAWKEAPWSTAVPEELFLNEILPYASLNERRENWRPGLRETSLPLVKEFNSAAEAAQHLNQKLFQVLKVKYSTKRERADQSPGETIRSGLATCTGLSILLVDACRAVGIPARIAATPLWSNGRGNHTWVEIWDGQWHFLGAAEPAAGRLDHGWFTHNAAEAIANEPEHAIYASSYRKTGLKFPLAWAPEIDYVSAVNITARYAKSQRMKPSEVTRLLITVLDRPGGERVAARVVITEPAGGAILFRGTSKPEGTDMNDVLSCELKPRSRFSVQARHGALARETLVTTSPAGEQSLVISLTEPQTVAAPAGQ